jgi:hypothetical protein
MAAADRIRRDQERWAQGEPVPADGPPERGRSPFEDTAVLERLCDVAARLELGLAAEGKLPPDPVVAGLSRPIDEKALGRRLPRGDGVEMMVVAREDFTAVLDFWDRAVQERGWEPPDLIVADPPLDPPRRLTPEELARLASSRVRAHGLDPEKALAGDRTRPLGFRRKRGLAATSEEAKEEADLRALTAWELHVVGASGTELAPIFGVTSRQQIARLVKRGRELAAAIGLEDLTPGVYAQVDLACRAGLEVGELCSRWIVEEDQPARS